MDPTKLFLTDQKAEDRQYAALEKQYGPRELMAANQDTIIGVLITAGIISKAQYVDLLAHMLAYRDEQRRREAGVPD